MHTPQNAPVQFARLRGHVAADIARLLASDSAALVDNGKNVAEQICDVLGRLAPKREEEMRTALTAFVDALTGAISEQSSGELFTNVHDVLAADSHGFAVTVLSEALDTTARAATPPMERLVDADYCIVSDFAGCELARVLGCWGFAD